MTYFASNLKHLRKKNGLTQGHVADALGIKSTSSISDWEADRYTPSVGVLNEIAAYFGIGLSDLMERDLSKPANISRIEGFRNIPLLGKIACGEPITAIENVDEWVPRPINDTPKGEFFYLIASGDSMEPLILDGSRVLCRIQSDVENGEIAAVLVNDDEEATLKRVRKLSGSMLLEPLNPQYNPVLINGDNQCRIIGKAIELTTKL